MNHPSSPPDIALIRFFPKGGGEEREKRERKTKSITIKVHESSKELQPSSLVLMSSVGEKLCQRCSLNPPYKQYVSVYQRIADFYG
jgi:hypothetical protein